MNTTRSSLAVAAYLVLSHALVFTAAWQGSWSTEGRAGPTEWLTASVGTVTALAAGIFALRWRLTGDTSSVWVARALGVYSAMNVVLPGIASSFAADTGVSSVAELLRAVGVFVVIGMLAIGAFTQPVDARFNGRRVAAVTTGVTMLGVALALLSADVRVLLGPALDQPPSGTSGALGQVLVGMVWLVLALAFVRRSARDGFMSTRWVGIMLIGLAEAHLALAMAVHGGPGWMLASQVARLLGVTAALVGAVHELQRTFTRQQSRLYESLVELGSTQARRRAEVAAAEERAHDIRGALFGVSCAAVTLERYQQELSDQERAELAKAVNAEIERLQEIIRDGRRVPEPFGVLEALRPVLACASARGTEVRTRVPADLIVFGRASELAEAIQNLLDNAHRYAPGSPVDISAAVTGNRIELRVEDRGPGVPPELRRLIFERGRRGPSDVEGSGLGLYVAARLVAEMDGDLRVEARPGGGASFVLALPEHREACE